MFNNFKCKNILWLNLDLKTIGICKNTLLTTLVGLLFSIFPIKYNTPFNIFIPGIFY
jgi:hypothetical protein